MRRTVLAALVGLLAATGSGSMQTGGQAPGPSARRPPARPAPPAAGETLAIVGGRVLPVSGPAIERGVVLIAGGRISAVGAGIAVPAGARVIDAAGKIVTPGWIDSSTTLGVVEITTAAEGTADQSTSDRDLGAAFNVLDAFNAETTVIPVTRAEGITRALVRPEGSGVVLGQAAVVDLSGAQAPDGITKAPAAVFAQIGEAGADAAGGSRASALLRLREALQDAIDFHRNRLAWDSARRRPYARGRLDLEALGPVVRGELPLAIVANRASDLLAAMRLARDFRLKLVLVGAAEGWKVADRIAAAKVPVVLKPLTNIPSFDAPGATLENASRLAKAGVVMAFGSFELHNSRNLRQEAGNAIASGLDPGAALRAVTLGPAQIWGVSSRYGALEPGLDADVVVWSGDPFELTTGPEHVFIKGREIPRGNRQRQLLERYRTLR